jgi:hypothetical protein
MKKYFAFGAALAFTFVAACSDVQQITQCEDIPDGGCPVQGGVECDDPTCSAGYTCNQDGTWTLAHTCPPHDASVDTTVNDAPPPSDAGHDIDAPPGAFGGPGCEMLETPDCPLGFALICNSGCCDCQDLYVCDDGGWDPWGTCSDDAGITPF